MSDSVYQIVTDTIIQKLEAGAVPWRKPWKSFGSPRNLISGKTYRGINAFLLSLSDHAAPFWLTYKQAEDCGGHVRKGEKSSIAVFYKQLEIERENAETGETATAKIPLLRFYRIFNSEQCEGICHKRLAEMQAASTAASEFSSISEAETVVSNMPNRPAMTEGGDRAYYRPSTDTVNLPARGQFESAESYYCTLFHELAHSTGHTSRLNRKGTTETAFFGSTEYGQEELVAEMSAAFLCGHCRISPPVIDNQAAYIASWLRAIRKDSKLLVFAAAQAQKAADFILGAVQSERGAE